MKLSDMSNGPDWIIWAAAALFALISIILLSGRGSGLIAGYNTASKEEKAIMGVLEDQLPGLPT